MFNNNGSRSNPPNSTSFMAKRQRRSGSLLSSRRKPFTSLVANRWILCKQSSSTIRFGEHVSIAYSKGGGKRAGIVQRKTTLS